MELKLNYKIENISSYYYDNNFNIGIIGYIEDSKDLWYPAFYKYDQYFQNNYEIFKTWNPKDVLNEIKKDYDKEVRESKIIGDYSILAYKLAKFGSEWDYKDKITILSDLLSQIYNILKDNTDPKIIEIFKSLKQNNMNEQLIYQAYFKVIFLLYFFFKDRYNTIKKIGLISYDLNEEKINLKADELLKNYFKYDNSLALNKSYIFNSFININKDLTVSKQIFNNLPKPQNKSIIILEGNKALLSDNINTDFSLSKSSLNLGEDLSNINIFKTEIIQDFKYPPKWSIVSLNDFFMNAIKQTRELPLFTISAKIEKDDKGLNETEKLYVKLLDLFENTPIKDDSYIGELIMTFNEQFTKMTNNLLNSNIRFKEGVLPKKLRLILLNLQNQINNILYHLNN